MKDKAKYIQELEHRIKALEADNHYFKSIIGEAHEGIMIVSRDYYIEFANPYALKNLNFTKSNIVGKRTLDVFPKEFAYKQKEHIEHAIKTAKPVKSISDCGQLSSTLIYENYIIPLAKKAGKIEHVICIFIDISDYIKAQAKLRENEEKFRILVENANDGIYVRTKDGHLEFVNDKFSEIHGYSREELIGMESWKLLHPDDLKNITEPGKPTSYIGKAYRGESRIITKSGEIRFVEMNTVPVKTSDGKEKVFGISRDVTERKKYEKALQENEEKYRMLIDAQGEGITEANTKNVFTFSNPAADSIFGVEEGQLTGKSIKDFMTQKEYEKVNRQSKDIKEGKISTYEVNIICPNNEKKTILVTASPKFDKNGKFIGSFGIFRDISKQKKAEATIEESNRQKYFLANSALDLVNLSSKHEIYDYITSTLHQHLEKKAIVTVVDFNYQINKWTLVSIEGIGKNVSKINSILGFDIFKMEGRIETGYLKEIEGGKLTKLEFNIPKLTNNLLSQKTGDALIKLLSIKDIYCITLKQKQNIYGNITIITRKKTKPLDAKLIEAFISQISSFIEKREAEQALIESEERFKMLTELTHEGIVIHENGTVIDFNPSVLKILGYTDETEIRGKNLFLYVDPKYHDIVKQKIAEQYTGVYEARIIHKSGKRIPVEVITRNVKLEDKNFRVVSIHDISERKEREKKIRQLSTAVIQSPVSIVITDMKGNIEFVNPQFTKVTGYSYEEALGNNPKILKTGHTPKEEYEKLWETVLKGNTWEGEFLNRRKDGLLYWEYATIAPIKNEEGEIINLLAIKEDISKRKASEEALLNSEKELRASNATKDKFFSILAHDLRGPIGNLMQLAGFLNENYSQTSEEKKEEYIKYLADLSSKSYDLLDNLLTWSRVQLNKMDFTPKPFHIYTTVSNSIDILDEYIQKKEITCTNSIPEKMQILANEGSIEVIVRNLLSNAIKFTPRGGKINIEARTIQDKKTSKNQIEIRIKDTGVGIPPDRLKKLFELDESYSTEGTDHEKGTGLGLIICKELVEKNGGTLKVDSKEFKGSTFSFVLPS